MSHRHGAVRGAVLFLVLLGIGAGAWWWMSRRSAVVPPAVPADVSDPEVRLALDQARREVVVRPGSAEAWGRFGMTLEAHLFEHEADRCFAEAARLAPADVRWLYFRGLYALKFNPDQAVYWLRRAAEAGEASAQFRSALRLRLAEALLEKQEMSEAEQLFRDERQRDPGNVRATLGLGFAARERGDLATAERMFHAARASPLTRKRATAHLAVLARARGDRGAADRFEKDLQTLPGDPIAWPDPLVDQILPFQVGNRDRDRQVAELERTRRFAEAAEIYLGRIKERPAAADYVGAGLNLARLGDYERAVQLIREGVRLEPDDARAQFTLAQVLFTRAEKQWHAKPGSDEARQGFIEVIGPARRATQVKPDHAQAYLFWGLALKYLGQSAESLAPLRQGLACRPESFELQFALGETLLEAGALGEARAHLENARRLDPRDPRLASAFERLDRTKP